MSLKEDAGEYLVKRLTDLGKGTKILEQTLKSCEPLLYCEKVKDYAAFRDVLLGLPHSKPLQELHFNLVKLRSDLDSLLILLAGQCKE